MGRLILLDANALIYWAAGKLPNPPQEAELVTSVICEIEVFGWRRLNHVQERACQEILGQLVVHGISDPIKVKAIKIRRTSSLKLPGAIVAATSAVLEAELWT